MDLHIRELWKSSRWWLLLYKTNDVPCLPLTAFLVSRVQSEMALCVYLHVHPCCQGTSKPDTSYRCKTGMALPEGRPPWLVYVPPELITHFLCLRIERKFISVLLAFWMWKHFLLLAKVFCKPQYSCKPCMLLNSQTIATTFIKTVLWQGKTLYDESWG